MTMSDSRAPNSNTYPRGGYQGGIPAAPYAPGQATLQGANPYQAAGPYRGYPQSYPVGPQVQMPPRVNWVSIACGAAVWALHLTTYLGLWLLTSTEFGKTHHSVLRFVGFIPQMTISVMVPLNMTGLIIGIMRLLGSVEEVAVELVGGRPQCESIYLFRNLFYPLGDGRQHALGIRARSSE